MNILIIEDDPNFAQHLSESFRRQDVVNRVSIIDSPDRLYEQIQVIWQYDVLLLDLTFHNDDISNPSGFSMIKNIREIHKNIPIIVISGQEKIDMIERAFSLGASDYISKSIRLSEIRVRVIYWFKRYYLKALHMSNDSYVYRNLLYDIEKNMFYHDNIIMNLSRSNKYILGIFMMNAEKVLSESYLIEKIWWDYEDLSSERNLRVAIARLRKILEEYGIKKSIESIYGEGYIFWWK